MKSKVYALILLYLIWLISIPLPAQTTSSESTNGFEGIIRYQIKQGHAARTMSMMPEFAEYRIRGKRIVIQMIGPGDAMMARVLIDGVHGAFYMIDDSARTAMKVQAVEESEEQIGNVPEEFREAYEEALQSTASEIDSNRIELMETPEMQTIAGYLCKKYIVIADAENDFIESEVWLSDQIRVDLPEVLKNENNPLTLFMDGKGFPLKFSARRETDSGDPDFEMTAVKITSGPMDPAEFEIPADYSISDMTRFLQGK